VVDCEVAGRWVPGRARLVKGRCEPPLLPEQ